jgi:hypothetical protein
MLYKFLNLSDEIVVHVKTIGFLANGFRLKILVFKALKRSRKLNLLTPYLLIYKIIRI